MGVKDLLLPFLLERFPSVFLQDPNYQLVPIAEWFNGFGITPAEIAQIVEEWPQVVYPMFRPPILKLCSHFS